MRAEVAEESPDDEEPTDFDERVEWLNTAAAKCHDLIALREFLRQNKYAIRYLEVSLYLYPFLLLISTPGSRESYAIAFGYRLRYSCERSFLKGKYWKREQRNIQICKRQSQNLQRKSARFKGHQKSFGQRWYE
jgi:hypothetical protein